MLPSLETMFYEGFTGPNERPDMAKIDDLLKS